MAEEKTEEQVKEELKQKQFKRVGETIITSVSVSKEFKKLMDAYDLSATETFRRGVAVMLYDLGIPQYQSRTNKERSAYVQEFLKQVGEEEKLQEKLEKVDLLKENLSEIKKNISSMKKIMEDLEE